MRVLRQNKESLVAVLEAVSFPLLCLIAFTSFPSGVTV